METYTETRCPTCGQIIPYKPYVHIMALGTWRKHNRDRPGYLKFSTGFQQILGVEPYGDWSDILVTTDKGKFTVGPTTWVYEKLTLDTPDCELDRLLKEKTE